jgi:hypothetical protein
MDIVIRALPTAYRASGEQLGEAFEELRARLLRGVDSARDAGSGESGTPAPR